MGDLAKKEKVNSEEVLGLIHGMNRLVMGPSWTLSSRQVFVKKKSSKKALHGLPFQGGKFHSERVIRVKGSKQAMIFFQDLTSFTLKKLPQRGAHVQEFSSGKSPRTSVFRFRDSRQGVGFAKKCTHRHRVV